MAASAKSFGISLGLNAAIGIICLLFFCIMRVRRLTRKFYMPRQFVESTDRAGKPRAISDKILGWLAPAWKTSEAEVIRVAGYDAAMYVKIISFAFEVFTYMSFWMIIIVLPVNLVGREVNRLTSQAQTNQTFSNLDKVTLTNVGEQSHLLWAHAVACWIVAIIVMRATWRYSKDAVVLHIMYLKNASHGAEAHSVIVTDIPGNYAGTVSGLMPQKIRRGVSVGAKKSKFSETLSQGTSFVLPSAAPHGGRTSSQAPKTSAVELGQSGAVKGADSRVRPSSNGVAGDLDAWRGACAKLNTGATVEDMVRDEYNDLYESDVNAVHVVYQSKDLDPLVDEYNGLVRKLEDLIDDYASKMQSGKRIKRKTTRVIGAKYGKWGKQNYGGWWPVKTDLMDWYLRRGKELRRMILAEQEKCRAKPAPTAFVTFKSRRAQTIAANSLQHTDVKSWHVNSAPEPNDIIWDNVKLRAWSKSTRFALIWTLFILLVLFYTIPIGAVQAIIEVNRLKNIPGIKQLVNIAFVRSIIEAILPGLVLNIFLALLPTLLRFMNKKQGMISKTQVDFGVNRKYYIFLVVTVFLGSIIGGTLFNQFNQWVDNPSSAVTILGTAAPLTSIFFLTYISLQALISRPLSFLRIFGLVMYWIKSKFAATPRAKARVWSQQRYTYGKVLPRHMLILLVGIVFSVINPLVPLIAILYFAVSLLIERYNMLYIYVPEADSGGKIWTEAFAQIVTALFFFEVIMIALLAIKKSFAAILVVPLLVITFVFWKACKPVFQEPLSVLALRTAVDMDSEDKLRGDELSLNDNGQKAQSAHEATLRTYMQPSMDFNETKHDTVLREVEDVDLALQGKKELDLQKIGGILADIEMGNGNGRTDARDMPTVPRRHIDS